MITPPTLALCASTGTFSCALRTEQGILARDGDPERRGDLLVLAAELCQEAGIPPSSLRSVLLDVGPGSYTGLRIAVTCAQMLRAFGSCAIATVTSLELLVVVASLAVPRTRVVLDARRGLLHQGVVALDSGRLQLVEEPRALLPEETASSLTAGETVLIAESVRHHLEAPCAAHQIPLVQIEHQPGARDLYDETLTPRPAGDDPIEPLYLMGTYAETPGNR